MSKFCHTIVLQCNRMKLDDLFLKISLHPTQTQIAQYYISPLMVHECKKLQISFAVTKFLITTGKNSNGYQRTSEMIDLAIKSDSSCKNWAEFPKDVDSATGGVIKETVVICGGGNSDESFDECYSLNGKVAALITQMSTEREYAASLVINGESLWITGGQSFNTGILASSEYIKLEGGIPGPDLPIPIHSHALVAINKTCSIFIGGGTTGYVTLPTVYYFEHEGKKWNQGPDLMQARRGHASGIVTDEASYDEFVIVTGGGYNGIMLDSTEILIDNQWNLGNVTHDCSILCNLITLLTCEAKTNLTIYKSFS